MDMKNFCYSAGAFAVNDSTMAVLHWCVDINIISEDGSYRAEKDARPRDAKRDKACVAKISEQKVIFACGRNSAKESTDKTWIYSIENNDWQQGPRALTKRIGSGCGAILDLGTELEFT